MGSLKDRGLVVSTGRFSLPMLVNLSCDVWQPPRGKHFVETAHLLLEDGVGKTMFIYCLQVNSSDTIILRQPLKAPLIMRPKRILHQIPPLIKLLKRLDPPPILFPIILRYPLSNRLHQTLHINSHLSRQFLIHSDLVFGEGLVQAA